MQNNLKDPTDQYKYPYPNNREQTGFYGIILLAMTNILEKIWI